MKKPTKSNTRIEFHIPREERLRIVESQRKFCADLADRLEAGDSLSDFERAWAAGALRGWVDLIGDEATDKRKDRRKIEYGNVAMHYACLRKSKGMKHDAAIAELAEVNGVSQRTIETAIGKYGKAAMRMIPKVAKK